MRETRADSPRIEVDDGALEGALRVLKIRSASVLFHVRARQYFVSRSELRKRAMRRAKKRMKTRRTQA